MNGTPLILESDKGQSGAICLAMVLGRFGSFPKLNVVKTACGVNDDEILPENLIKVASRFGFDTHVKTGSVEELEINSPIIVRTTAGKYLLVVKKSFKRYIVHDTEKGKLKLTKEKFKTIFGGWSLKLKPNSDFKILKKQGSFNTQLLRRVFPNLKKLAYVFIAGLILLVPKIVVPAFNKLFFDDIIILSQYQWFYPMITTLAVFIILGCTLTYLQQWVLLKIEIRTSISESFKFISHILKVPYNYFLNHKSGETVKRIRLNDSIATLLTTDLSNAILQTITILMYGVIMLKYNWILALVGVSIMLGNIFALNYFSKKRTALNQSLFKNQQAIFSTASNGIEQIETIKASGSENDFFSLWSSRLINSINNQQKLGVTSRILAVLPTFIDQFKTITILLLGGLLIINGEITIGVFLAIQSFLSSLSKPVQSLVEFTGDLQVSKADINNLTDSFEEPVDAFCEDKTKESFEDITSENSKLSGKIEVNNISFGYSKFSEPLIENFSLSTYPGKRIAIIGGSGSGKSTLLKVLSGLYQPISGEIKYDGKNLNNINKDVLRNSLSLIDQETFFFKGTISDNITMWNNSIENSRIIQSSKDAVIHEIISEREGGYKSKVAPDGKNFSGGQRQRLEIARAFVTNPSILFLDEATSALDTETEKMVMKSILNRKCTTITIAHRLSTIKDFDEIIVLEKGKVIQRGNHSELIKDQQGLYYQLIKEA
jgi:NHLM bacteriocin system ABC transporter peptidase/ATP-binding protein